MLRRDHTGSLLLFSAVSLALSGCAIPPADPRVYDPLVRVAILLLFNQPLGFNTILALIALAGIIMRNTLILIGRIH